MTGVKGYGSCQFYLRGVTGPSVTELVAATLRAQADDHQGVWRADPHVLRSASPPAGIDRDYRVMVSLPRVCPSSM